MRNPPTSTLRCGLLLALASFLFLLDPASAMNKSELIEAIATSSGLSKADSKRALGGFISATQGALKKGDRISLVGFGSWSVSKRAARTGRNPQTGKEIKTAAKNVVKFKAGADLSGKVNRRLVVRDDPTKLATEKFSGVTEVNKVTHAIQAVSEDGIACYDLPSALARQGIRSSVTLLFLPALVKTINHALASKDYVEIEGFGRFWAEGGNDGLVFANFQADPEFELSVKSGVSNQFLSLVSLELTHVTQHGGAQSYLDILASSNQMVALCDEYGDEQLYKSFAEIRHLIMNAEEDFTKFYDKCNQAAGTRVARKGCRAAAGTRVRKTMQELKNVSQEIRKEVQDKKNNG